MKRSREKEAQIVKSLAQLPPITVTASPLLLLILAVAIPGIIQDPNPDEYAAYLKREGQNIIDEITSKLPKDVVAMFPDLVRSVGR
jgi:hypothetical protein